MGYKVDVSNEKEWGLYFVVREYQFGTRSAGKMSYAAVGKSLYFPCTDFFLCQCLLICPKMVNLICMKEGAGVNPVLQNNVSMQLLEFDF